MYPSHNRQGYNEDPPRISGPAQVPMNDFSVQLQAAPLVNTALSTPSPSYESQGVPYTPQLHGHHGLPEQGSGYSAYTGPALQRPQPLLTHQYLPQQATNNVYANHSAYTALNHGMSAYMPQQATNNAYAKHATYTALISGASAALPQQGSGVSTTVGHTQSWIGIGGGVDLRRRHLPPIEGDLERNVRVRFPDGTMKIVSDHGHVVTLRMAAKAVQEWYRQSSNSSSSLLNGFRVVDGVYVAHIV